MNDYLFEEDFLVFDVDDMPDDPFTEEGLRILIEHRDIDTQLVPPSMITRRSQQAHRRRVGIRVPQHSRATPIGLTGESQSRLVAH